MTIACKACGALMSGPQASIAVIDRDLRNAAEYGGLYPEMSKHIHTHHPEVAPILGAFVDQYALMLASKMFESANVGYEEMRERSRAASWATMNANWPIVPRGTSPM